MFLFARFAAREPKAHHSDSEVSLKKEQAKLESVGVFDEAQSLSTKPFEIVTREECWARKKKGDGYFVDSGTKFRMVRVRTQQVHPVSTRFGSVRDESANPDDDTIVDYVFGERRALAIINIGWMPQYRLCATV